MFLRNRRLTGRIPVGPGPLLIAVATSALIIGIVIFSLAGPNLAQAQSDGVPARPTGLTGTVNHDTVALTWDDPGDSSITGYQILRLDRAIHRLGDFQIHVDDTGSSANSYTDRDVEPSHRYVYRIKARNPGGLSPRSSFFNADTPAAPAEPPPIIADDCANNTSTLCAVTVGDYFAAAIGEEGDVDWIKVMPTANTFYRIEISRALNDSDALVNPYMGGLYDANGILLRNTQSNRFNRIAGTGAGFSTLSHHFLADTDEAFFVAVGGRRLGPMPATGDYRLRVVEETSSPDDFSARSTTSGDLTLGEATSAKLERLGDIDWFKLDLQQGQVYRIAASGNTNISAIYHVGSGNEIVKRSRGDHYPSYRDYDLAWIKAANSGTHYIEIRPGHALGDYNIKVEHISLPASDVAAAATTTQSVALNGSTHGRIDNPDDVDWIRIHLTAGAEYRIELKGSRHDEGTLDSPLLAGIYNGDGVISRGTYSTSSKLTYRPDTTGDHYIAVSALAGIGVERHERTGIFKLSVAWVDGSIVEPSGGDCAGTIETTCRVEVGDRVTGEISDSSETDWFKVSLTPGQLYRFELQNVVAGYDWQVALRLPDGSAVIRGVVSFHHAADAEAFAYRPFRSGEHFLEVKTYNNPAHTTYTLKFWEIEVDETGDCAGDPTTSCSISVGGSKTGYLARYLFGDKDFDWWGVTLEEGETYVIDMKGSGDSTPARDNPQTIADPLVALHNSAGFKVAVNNNIQEFNDGVANYNSRTTYTIPDGEGGTYYVSAVSGETHLGTYEITVQLSE